MQRASIIGIVLVAACAAGGCEARDAEDTDVAGEMTGATLNEWSVVLERDSLAPGTYTFNVVNEGTVPHVLEIEGGGEEWETEEIRPGGRATLTVQLEPGTYEAYCPIRDDHGAHDDLGMRTTLIVRP